MSTGLAEFLVARIGDDEARAREEIEDGYGGWQHESGWPSFRVLAECAVKREIVSHLLSALDGEKRAQRTLARLGPDHREAGEWEAAATRVRQEMVCVAWHLAQPYTDHPDFDKEWQPA